MNSGYKSMATTNGYSRKNDKGIERENKLCLILSTKW